jgi:hypothetical protein
MKNETYLVWKSDAFAADVTPNVLCHHTNHFGNPPTHLPVPHTLMMKLLRS